MTEPLKLLELIARRTDKVYIWTHFYPDDAVPSYVRTRYVQWQGKTVPQFERPYFMMRPRHQFRGGVYSGRAWLRRSDVLDALKTLGFVRIDITHEDYSNRLGPSFAVLARKAQ